eukprot:m.255044 g.255044  ORF g.255044 m.255044 type:complete len:209 (+) comp40390_c1_seq4:259-885(+)
MIRGVKVVYRLVVKELKRGKKECWDDLKPLPNPPGYRPPPPRPKYPLRVHFEIWKDVCQAYKYSWIITIDGTKRYFRRLFSLRGSQQEQESSHARHGKDKLREMGFIDGEEERDIVKQVDGLVEEGKLSVVAAKEPSRRFLSEGIIIYKQTVKEFVAGYNEGVENPMWDAEAAIEKVLDDSNEEPGGQSVDETEKGKEETDRANRPIE